uniref:Uncharacterized protein n=1 Tax=Nothobranchius furzeri TaxID=105023 RepID=A0A8C6VXV4_NOTFU
MTIHPIGSSILNSLLTPNRSKPQTQHATSPGPPLSNQNRTLFYKHFFNLACCGMFCVCFLPFCSAVASAPGRMSSGGHPAQPSSPEKENTASRQRSSKVWEHYTKTKERH